MLNQLVERNRNGNNILLVKMYVKKILIMEIEEFSFPTAIRDPFTYVIEHKVQMPPKNHKKSSRHRSLRISSRPVSSCYTDESLQRMLVKKLNYSDYSVQVQSFNDHQIFSKLQVEIEQDDLIERLKSISMKICLENQIDLTNQTYRYLLSRYQHFYTQFQELLKEYNIKNIPYKLKKSSRIKVNKKNCNNRKQRANIRNKENSDINCQKNIDTNLIDTIQSQLFLFKKKLALYEQKYVNENLSLHLTVRPRSNRYHRNRIANY